MLNILEAKHFMQLERIFLLNLIKMRTLNDLLCLIRTQVLVYMDDHYFCCCWQVIKVILGWFLPENHLNLIINEALIKVYNMMISWKEPINVLLGIYFPCWKIRPLP